VMQGRREGKTGRDRGLASELARQTKWLGVGGATEQKRWRDKASLRENCGGGRDAGEQCLQDCRRRGTRARRQQRGLERWRDGEATRGRGRSRRWPAATRNGVLCRRQGEPEAQSREQRLREEEGERMEPGTVLQIQRKTRTSL
jgi:hypothetical protein